MDPTAPATLLAWLDREIWLVTAQAGSRRGGLIATLVGPASVAPDMPRLIVGLAHSHFTWELVEASGTLALHMLGEDNIDLVWHFGLQSGRNLDKLAGVPSIRCSQGCPILENTVGWMSCRVEERMETGDRTIYLAEVVEGKVTRFAPPLTLRRLHEVAPKERLADMQRQRHHDGLLDAEAISLWRQRERARRQP